MSDVQIAFITVLFLCVMRLYYFENWKAMFYWRHIRMHFRGMGGIRRDEKKWSSLWLYRARNKHHLCPYCFDVVELHVSVHTEKRGRERHYGIAAQWSLLWGPNTLTDHGFVSGYCCSLSVERKANPGDFSNGISETPMEWALVLIPVALSAVSGRIGPRAWSEGAALHCNEERSAVSFSLLLKGLTSQD